MNLLWDHLSTAANWTGPGGTGQRLFEHLAIALGALIVAAVLALPLGVMVGHARRGDDLPILIGVIGRLVPSMGVLGYVAMKTEAGSTPAFAVVVLFTAAPIMSAGYAGVRLIDRSVVDSARGAGMLPPRVLREIELPMAMPDLIRGLRRGAVTAMAVTAAAAYVGAGGLGRLILDGQAAQVRSYGMMATGGVLLAVFSIAVDRLIATAGAELISPGLAVRTPEHGNEPEMILLPVGGQGPPGPLGDPAGLPAGF